MVKIDDKPDRDTRVRNVLEKYAWWTNMEIKDDLESHQSGFVPVFLNFDSDFNISSGIRCANWYNTSSPHIVGRRKVDMRGAVGVQNYMEIHKRPDIEPLIEDFRQQGFAIVAAEIDDEAVPLPEYEWPKDVVVIFGQESRGVDPDILKMCDEIIYIPGRGSVKSLNVATTSGIFMYDYCVKTKLF